MIHLSYLAFAVILASCSQQPSQAATLRTAGLPSKFVLACSAPVGPIYRGTSLFLATRNGFQIKVDLSKKRFWTRWDKKWDPLQRVGSQEIVFVSNNIKNGPDNNPASYDMRFDVPSGKLSYINVYAGVIYHNENFLARCQVNPDAETSRLSHDQHPRAR